MHGNKKHKYDQIKQHKRAHAGDDDGNVDGDHDGDDGVGALYNVWEFCIMCELCVMCGALYNV